MDQFATRAIDTMRQTVGRVSQTAVEVKERWRHLPYRSYVLPAVGLFAAVGLAAPLLHFAGSQAGQAQEDIAAQVSPDAPATLAAKVDVPAPVVVEIRPVAVATDQRSARVEQGVSLDANLNKPEARVIMLPDDDPRWARAATDGSPKADGKPAVPETIETAELRSKLEQLQAPVPAVQAAVADPARETPATDATFTGAIPPRSADDTVQPAQDDSPQPAEQVAAVLPNQEEPVAEDAAAGRAAQITTHVNMRSGPENEAAVLTVLPSGTSVNVIGGCEHWCEVDFDGTRGYVYKSFVSGS